MAIKTGTAVIDIIKIDKKDPRRKYCSIHSLCVRSLLSELEAGDNLMVNELSDPGDKDSEAKELYFAFHRKGICQFFYDSSFLDTEVLELPGESSVDQKDHHELLQEYRKKRAKKREYPVQWNELSFQLILYGIPVPNSRRGCRISGDLHGINGSMPYIRCEGIDPAAGETRQIVIS